MTRFKQDFKRRFPESDFSSFIREIFFIVGLFEISNPIIATLIAFLQFNLTSLQYTVE